MENAPIYDTALSRSRALDELREVVNYRELIRQLVRRDILTRYKRSVLGLAWTMLNPLGMMLVLTLAFSRLFNATPAYPAYVLSGLVAWTFFSQTTTIAITQLVWGGDLLRRIYMPRTVFAVSSIGTGLVNLALSLVPLFVVMVITGAPIRLSALFLPVSMLLLACFALGVGLLLSTIAVYFPDVAEMYQIVLMGWMYLTPIIYPEEIVPEAYRLWLFNLNPMYHLVKLFRLPLYYGLVPSGVRIAAATAVALGTLIVGWVVFTRKADDFAYRA